MTNVTLKNNSISSVIAAETARLSLSDVGIDTNNYDFSMMAEINLRNGDEKLMAIVKDSFRKIGICKGTRKLSLQDFAPMISIEKVDVFFGTEKHILDTTEESIKAIVSLLKQGDINDIDTLLVCSLVLQLLGRYNQEVGIDSYKTFIKAIQIFKEKMLKGMRSSMKDASEINIKWDDKEVDNVPVREESEHEPFFVNSVMSETRDEMMSRVAAFAKANSQRIQRLDKVRSYLSTQEVFEFGAVYACKWLQQDFMTISYATLQSKKELSKMMDDNLDKVAREANRAKFDDYFAGQRNLLRKMLASYGYQGKDAALVALQAGIENLDKRNKKTNKDLLEAGKEIKDFSKESEKTSNLVEKLLKEEYSLLLLTSKHIAKEELILCDIEEGTEVEFINHTAVYEGKAAYGINVPDGTYTIKNIDGKFYAVKVVKEYMEEQIKEQDSSMITVQLKKSFFDTSLIFKRGVECGIELKDIHRDKNGTHYDAVVINGVCVGKFDCPFPTKENASKVEKEMFNAVKAHLKQAAFEGKYFLKKADTFECSNGQLKTFMVLTK